MSKRRTRFGAGVARRVGTPLLALLVLSSPSASAGTPPAGQATLPDDSADDLLYRAFVPSADKPQAEVRLAGRAGGHVVQTVLYSKLLKRAVAKILDKERRHWPESSAGHEDSMRYTRALVAAREEVAAKFADRQDRSERRQALMIEFVLVDGKSFLILAEPQVEVDGAIWRVSSRRVLAVLEPSTAFVRANMRLIAVDALGLDPEQAERAVP